MWLEPNSGKNEYRKGDITHTREELLHELPEGGKMRSLKNPWKEKYEETEL